MSASPNQNLLVRFLTAVVAAPILLGLLYFGPPWGWFALLCGAASIGAFELFSMTHAGDRVAQGIGVAFTLGVMGVLWERGADARALLALLLVLPFAALLVTLARLGELSTATLRVATMAFAPLYVGGGFASIALLRRDAGDDGPGFIVLVLMLSWLSDTGAYFAGRAFGKRKLFEAVSPKKTVEGALGGLAFAILGALLAHFFYLRSLPLEHGLALAIVAGGLGQAGDLGESMIKRSVGVKDSGGIVPGHGGILDRVDALLVANVVTYLYVVWVRL